MKLVGSSFLIDFTQGYDAARGFLEGHDDDRFGASTIVLSEVYRGLFLMQDMTREEVRSRFEWLAGIAFDTRVAIEAAEIYVELREDGTMINKSDIYIAATARAHGVTLVVNDDHFDAIGGLDVETYR